MQVGQFEVRRENLRQYILNKHEGNRASFSRAAGVHQNHINLLLTDNTTHRRNLGEALARKIEETVGLPSGWLDQEHGASVQTQSIPSGEADGPLSTILRRGDTFASATMMLSWINQIPRLTHPDNLVLYTVVTQDLTPELAPGDHVLIDKGVKAVSGDGVYILARGTDLYLRRLSRLLSGHWTIRGGPEGSITAESLKGLKAVGAVVGKLEASLL